MGRNQVGPPVKQVDLIISSLPSLREWCEARGTGWRGMVGVIFKHEASGRGCSCVLLVAVYPCFQFEARSRNRTLSHKARGDKACRLVACRCALNVPSFSTHILCPQWPGALLNGRASAE